MNSIKLKMIAIFTAVVLVVFIVSGTIMLFSVRINEQEKYREQLRQYADNIKELVVLNEENHNAEDFNNEFMDRGGLPGGAYGMQGCVLNSVGMPIAPFEFISQRLNDSAITLALSGSEGFSVNEVARNLDDTEQSWITFAMTVLKGTTSYVVYVRMNSQSLNENLTDLAGTLILMVGVAIVLTSVLWFIFSDTLIKPIAALTRHAKNMTSRDLTSKIVVHSKDEIGQLAETFNEMAEALNQNMGTIESEKNKSEALLHNLTDGVLAYDATGKLIHANNTCIEMLEDTQEMTMSAMLTRLGFDANEVYGLSPNEAREAACEAGERFLSSCITPYMNKENEVDGFVIVIQDVTKMTKLDNMRKEFVANVSHELRTPLTSVKTYTETLLDGAIEEPETARQFLKVINDETQRMSVLITDLLELSRLDNKQIALEKEVVDLAGLLRFVIRQSQVLALKKRQRINFEPPNKPYFIEANASRINQVLTNIITNSVKYSPEETSIDVNMEATEKYYRIFVRDHGMGIPNEDLPHIFERFYRVDKARSRMMGGTGLGLAIAREIMEEHGGRIYVTSELGAGTTMTLRFKRYKGES
jgi:two-component system sensor histidine kinase VicK